jgi:hypothetical protein
MENKGLKFWSVLITVFLGVLSGNSQNDSSKVNFNGQLVGWTTAQFENPFVLQPGGRFVPTLTGKFAKNDSSAFDFEASLNINGNVTFEDWRKTDATVEISPYRVWARYATNKLEVRAGLQKINFGQAKLFRPLMWFDGMDVRDPLQLTNGVYGVLGKYFFENNANLWLWGLIGNENRKGWELFGTEKWKPEVGGRIELPVPKGEMALTTHYRKVHAVNMLSSAWNDYRLLNENRIGLDGKWDVGVGLWFESSTTITQQNSIMVPRFQDMWNVGMDYTLPVGNGVGVTLEYLRYHAGNEFFVNGNTANLVGVMLSYPLSIMDNLSAMLFYLPEQNALFNYVTWSRNYDKWSIYAIGFWNPTNAQMLTIQSGNSNLFAGKGLQVMVSYNF